MLIDWFTVAAQVVNFLVLVWLLKRFLYKPILGAIDARERRIADVLADAEAKRREAQKERDDFKAKTTALDGQRDALLKEASDEAAARRTLLLDDARREADGLRARQSSALRDDQSRLGTEISRLAQEEVFGIARKALADLATVSLEERIVDAFIRRLREMGDGARDALRAALMASSVPAVVRSRFELSPGQRAAIQGALNECLRTECRIQFETAGETICGIEVSANGRKLAWSLADYLAGLEERIGAVVVAQAAPVATVGAPAEPK